MTLLELKQKMRQSRADQFAEEGGEHWVTMGGSPGPSGEHEGGTPVELNSKGTIVKGAEGLVGHKPSAIPPKHRQEQIKKIIGNRVKNPPKAVPKIDPHYQLPAKSTEANAPSEPVDPHEHLATRHHAAADAMEKGAPRASRRRGGEEAGEETAGEGG